MKRLADYFGISRQAYYKAIKSESNKKLSEHIALQLVGGKRIRQPMIGVRKLYFMLSCELRSLPKKIGRDALFDILRQNSLLIRRKKRKYYTTNSNHNNKVYPNLIKDLEVNRSNQVYASDITFLRHLRGFSFLSLVSDHYSRKIVGHHLSDDLSTEGPLKALRISLKWLSDDEIFNMIHHSDRGTQYSSIKYVEELKRSNIQISMSSTGSPYENGIMERIIGILKEEYLLNRTFRDIQEIKKAVKEAIEIYNSERPHLSLDYKTPEEKYNENVKEQAA